MKRMIFLALFLFGSMRPASATLLWTENFSDVSDWTVIFNLQGGSAGINSDGSLGTFSVAAPANEVAFGPIGVMTGYVPFNPLQSGDYGMLLNVNNLSGSTSYDVRLDEFDAGSSYIGTVFNVLPQGTFTGTTNINLGGFTYNASTAFLLPKVSVFTGVGDQTVTFDTIQFEQVPEPWSASLLVCGAGALLLQRRARRVARS